MIFVLWTLVGYLDKQHGYLDKQHGHDEAEKSYMKIKAEIEAEIKRIDNIIRDNGREIKDYNNITKYWLELHDRLANTCERLADCTFYGDVITVVYNNKVENNKYGQAAQYYEDAAKEYETAQQYSMIPVMKIKQAIMLHLSKKDHKDDEAKESYRAAIDEANKQNLNLYNKTRYVLLIELANAMGMGTNTDDKEQNEENCCKKNELNQQLIVFAQKLYPNESKEKFSLTDKDNKDNTEEVINISLTNLLVREN